ncbi:Na/Pi cotransporter family protein [Heliorestis acidaminivorans]|uniref:Na/Pi cotransporter family protein n=1 Tax=Heliorestis acidaminivorans TaxID=553427 RepID=A0A6I0F490_9FIRM|nr:Na/Pi symporter [Heliorestis acidaminivorans]KAB2953392.1 Na/Pi cotransporter family protein [Heliorestis acidaminivorans]
MNLLLSTTLGGIGLFLLGMLLMTDGLKKLAGDALRRLLSRFTGGTFTSILSGAGITALIQSSSATTLMTIGFVSAGLLSFSQAVGVIIGSNVGTTSTAWIVSTLGLKLNIAALAMPFVALGALLKLLGKGKMSAWGIFLAGFGLIFVGIDFLQQGMAGVAEQIDLSAFQGDSFFNLLLLIVVGSVMTVLMQSSSAAVATTLAALHTNAIVLDQAAALVIGQNVGTTVKAALASIGGSIAVKRTALAHILFNLITGLVALMILPLFIKVITESVRFGGTDPAIAIAAFHTFFNMLGLLLIAPFIHPFSHMIERMLPEKGPVLTKHLDPALTEVVPVAVEAVRRTLLDTTALLMKATSDMLDKNKDVDQDSSAMKAVIEEAELALHETRAFIGSLHMNDASTIDVRRHLATLHAIDHIDRFIEAIKEKEYVQSIHSYERLEKKLSEVVLAMAKTAKILDNKNYRQCDRPLTKKAEAEQEGLGSELKEIEPCEAPEKNIGSRESRKSKKEKKRQRKEQEALEQLRTIEKLSLSIADQRRTDRALILEATALGESDPERGLSEINTLKWIDRMTYHLWRLLYHLIDKEGEEVALRTAGVYGEGIRETMSN